MNLDQVFRTMVRRGTGPGGESNDALAAPRVMLRRRGTVDELHADDPTDFQDTQPSIRDGADTGDTDAFDH